MDRNKASQNENSYPVLLDESLLKIIILLGHLVVVDLSPPQKEVLFHGYDLFLDTICFR